MKLRRNFLTEILSHKRSEVAGAKKQRTIAELQEFASRARAHMPRHALRQAIRSYRNERETFAVIAEIKRASPSQGIIRREIAPSDLAKRYEQGGAAAISVVTDACFFGGSLEDLRQTKKAVSLPILRKDFIIDDSQVFESAAAGADAILLIVAALDDAKLLRLRQLAEDSLGMDALVEVHTAEELCRADASGADLIGVNNRDLHTFEVSLEVSHQLIEAAPADAILISESGLRTRADLERLHKLGFDGFLIGETLMRASNPAEALRELAGQRACCA